MDDWKKEYEKQLDDIRKESYRNPVDDTYLDEDGFDIDDPNSQKLIQCARWKIFRIPAEKLREQQRKDKQRQEFNNDPPPTFDDMGLVPKAGPKLSDCEYQLNVVLNRGDTTDIQDFIAKICQDRETNIQINARKPSQVHIHYPKTRHNTDIDQFLMDNIL